MAFFPLLAVGFIMKVIAGFFIFSAVVLVLVVLIQRGRGGGLSAAFGGGMAGGLLGSKTGDFLTWVTIVLVGIFLTLAVVMAKFYIPGATTEFDRGRPVQREQPFEKPPAAAGDANVDSDTNLPGG